MAWQTVRVRRTLLGLVAIIFTSTVDASALGDLAWLTPDERKAFDQLATTVDFSTSMVGAAGDESWQVASYRLLLAAKNPQQTFEALFERATEIGKVYALIGLYGFDEKRTRTLAAQTFSQAYTSVRIQSGCLVTFTTLRDIVFGNQNAESFSPAAAIRSGNYNRETRAVVNGGYTREFAPRGQHPLGRREPVPRAPRPAHVSDPSLPPIPMR